MPIPHLLGPDGRLLTTDNGTLIPHAQTFASVMNAVSRTYSYRYDEAIRDSRVNALAMRRDAYLKALLQERKKPTAKLKWEIEVDKPEDPMQAMVKEGVTRLYGKTWRRRRQLKYLLEAIWYGRYGSQIVWTRDAAGQWYVGRHMPVNGDKIPYQWDGTPCIRLYAPEAGRFSKTDPEAVITTDGGSLALRLYKPEWRREFVIHQHDVEDADFFEGEAAGAVHGIGLRSYAYWSYWIRQEMLDWMLSFMESVGMTDLLVFNFPDGNAAAKAKAEENAKKITGKMALVVPRPQGDKYQAVETIPVSTAGIDALKGMIEEYCERHLERLFVGQTLSGSSEGNGLGGSGVAQLHRDTKYHLIEDDANELSETLTEDLITPMVKLNYPWADFPVRLKLLIPDPESEIKLSAAKTITDMGVKLKAEEVRILGGFTKPEEGDETTGAAAVSPVGAILDKQGIPGRASSEGTTEETPKAAA